MTLENVLYTANVHTTGARENGTARTDDGRLDIKLSSAAVSSILIFTASLEEVVPRTASPQGIWTV